MSQAQTILSENDYYGAVEAAEIAAVSIDQDWDEEMTKYVFDDDSVLIDQNGTITIGE